MRAGDHPRGRGEQCGHQILTTGDAEWLHGGFSRQGESCRGCRLHHEVNPVGIAFAHLLDPAGNHFAVVKPPFVQARFAIRPRSASLRAGPGVRVSVVISR